MLVLPLLLTLRHALHNTSPESMYIKREIPPFMYIELPQSIFSICPELRPKTLSNLCQSEYHTNLMPPHYRLHPAVIQVRNSNTKNPRHGGLSVIDISNPSANNRMLSHSFPIELSRPTVVGCVHARVVNTYREGPCRPRSRNLPRCTGKNREREFRKGLRLLALPGTATRRSPALVAATRPEVLQQRVDDLRERAEDVEEKAAESSEKEVPKEGGLTRQSVGLGMTAAGAAILALPLVSKAVLNAMMLGVLMVFL
ncbi:hypothetical protein QBC39DRAFT_163213 [Podospora conica]|nr:hypothetical protein QBC39DRAFT_163213 [Schizothecium conicum]